MIAIAWFERSDRLPRELLYTRICMQNFPKFLKLSDLREERKMNRCGSLAIGGRPGAGRWMKKWQGRDRGGKEWRTRLKEAVSLAGL